MNRIAHCILASALLSTLLASPSPAWSRDCDSYCAGVVRSSGCVEGSNKRHPEIPMCSDVRVLCHLNCNEENRGQDRSNCRSSCERSNSCDSKSDDSERLSCYDGCRSECGG